MKSTNLTHVLTSVLVIGSLACRATPQREGDAEVSGPRVPRTSQQAGLHASDPHGIADGTRYVTGMGLPDSATQGQSAAMTKLESYLDGIATIPLPAAAAGPQR